VVYQTTPKDWHVGAAPTVRLVHPLALDPAMAAAWDGLAAQASEPNVFAERWCLAPALQLLDAAREARLLAVEIGDELIGMAAMTVAPRYGPLPLRHQTNWTHSNHFHGAPLVRAGHELTFWSALIDWCGVQPQGRLLLQWSGLTEDGPLHRALVQVVALAGGAAPTVHRAARALLASDLTPEAYWEAAVRGKKRKELRRQANRLAEAGPLDQQHWQPDDPVDPWIEAFLELEAQGWKGREASALASDPGTAAWFRTIITGAGAAGRLDMRMLAQNGRPLAMLINFLAPPGGFSFKTAFAEDAARFSPGVLLQQANLDLLHRADLHWVDSCAAEGHPMIDSIWRERRTLAWVNVPLGGRAGRFALSALMRAETAWHSLRRRNPEAAEGDTP
jgi:CelD/BcsL family acetyltransferase involved in cellulose biosynthesis